MAESLPPESDNKKPDANDEELVQIGTHGTVFPPPEEATAATGAVVAATTSASAKTTEMDEMNADHTTKTPAAPPVEEAATASQAINTEAGSEPKSAKGDSCLTGCLHDVLLVLISALVAGALVLGVLLFLNGTLDMRGHDAVVALNSYQETLSDNLSTLSGQVDANEESLNALDQELSDTNGQLEGVDGHVQTIDSQVQELNGQMQTLGTEVQALDAYVQALGGQVQDIDDRTQAMDIKITTVREEVVVLNQEVAKLSVRSDNTEAEIADINQQMSEVTVAAERFDTFTEGLRSLAESLSQPDETSPDSASPEPEISSTEPISNTEPVTVSITITTTETISAAETISPTVSLPLVGNRVDANAENTEENASVPPSIDNIPSLTLFPPLEPLPELSTGKSHIFGLVWDDLDGDGQLQEEEGPIPAVSIILRDARGNVIATTVTDSAGRYLFANVAPGVYIVEETDPEDVISILSNLITVTAPAESMVETNFADQY